MVTQWMWKWKIWFDDWGCVFKVILNILENVFFSSSECIDIFGLFFLGYEIT